MSINSIKWPLKKSCLKCINLNICTAKNAEKDGEMLKSEMLGRDGKEEIKITSKIKIKRMITIIVSPLAHLLHQIGKEHYRLVQCE
jgi:hypothetical protein